jgi:hypothetical protein
MSREVQSSEHNRRNNLLKTGPNETCRPLVYAYLNRRTLPADIMLRLIIVALVAISSATTVLADSVDVQIATSSDDAEERSDGRIYEAEIQRAR